MTWLVAIGLTNAVLASALAIVAGSVGYWGRRPALARLLWVVVLAKLLTPPLYEPVTIAVLAPSNTADAGRAVPAPVAAQPPAGQPDSAARSTAHSPEMNVEPRSQAPINKSLEGASVRPLADAPSRVWRMLAAARPTTWLYLAGIAWVVGSVTVVARLALRSWRFRQFLSWAARSDAELDRRAAQLAGLAGLRSSPRVLVVDSVVSPMLWGAGSRARLLFPAELARGLTPAARDALLLHELAHYARGDWLVRLLELATQVAYWWHPLVWWARRQIEAAEEECCDAWVLEHQPGTRRGYAEALLAALDFLSGPVCPLPPAACGLSATALLRARLTQIMCGSVSSHASRRSRALVFVAALLVLPVSPAFVAVRPREAAANSTLPVANAPLPTAPPVPLLALEAVPEKSAATAAEKTATSPAESWFVPRPPVSRPAVVLYATAVAPNGRYRIEARTGRRATLVEVASEKRLDLSSYRIVAASFSPDGRLLVTGQDDESGVRLWDCETGAMLRLFKGSEAVVTSVAFSPDGEHLAAGAADGGVLVWNVGDAELVARLTGQEMPVSCLRWSKRGDRLAIALGEWSDRDSSSLVVWRPDEATISRQLSFDQTSGAIDWLADDALIVADWNGAAQVVDLTTSTAVKSLWLGKDLVSAAAFSPDCPLMPRWQATEAEQ